MTGRIHIFPIKQVYKQNEMMQIFLSNLTVSDSHRIFFPFGVQKVSVILLSTMQLWNSIHQFKNIPNEMDVNFNQYRYPCCDSLTRGPCVCVTQQKEQCKKSVRLTLLYLRLLLRFSSFWFFVWLLGNRKQQMHIHHEKSKLDREGWVGGVEWM